MFIDVVKKKKRAHREVEDDGFGELDDGDPTGKLGDMHTVATESLHP